jgi:hypothetical protein
MQAKKSQNSRENNFSRKDAKKNTPDGAKEE